MAEQTRKILSVIATTASKIPEISIKDAQLIFVKDSQKVALDLNGKRTFYNQIVTLQTESERTLLLAPISHMFYFVIQTAVLWFYDGDWVQLTTPPKEVLFIGESLPELGVPGELYVDTTQKSISVWNDSIKGYELIAQKIEPIPENEILAIFNKGD